MKAAVGLIGGYGAVGRAAAAQLAAWGRGPVLVAGRDAARADVVLDLDDGDALAAFCDQVEVTVNCAGPSYRVLDRVARAALAAGSHYVDPGGDDPVHDLLAEVDTVAKTVVLSAGMLPGLTGLLPRALAVGTGAALTSLTGYVGGRDRFTAVAAADYLASLHNGFGRPNQAWRAGRRSEQTLSPLFDVDLPHFPDAAAAHPYLSTEMERLARRLRISDLTFYNVFLGKHLLAALAEPAGDKNDGSDDGIDRLTAAADLDLLGRDPHQRLVFHLDARDGTRAALVLSGHGASELTGATVALAACAVLDGAVPSGVHFAADVLDPLWAVERLRTAAAVQAIEIYETVAGPQDASGFEEGEL
ncbi:hypothetical protein ABIA35_007195 [Catenulispora sp. MAP12-49]|uniref:saccharopine dehydrogenase NADP-binding domain-containing protein n=1 Tax=Catenulispora sp. MAP12-49 TaxID=3156302 RepID=UPI0035131A1A